MTTSDIIIIAVKPHRVLSVLAEFHDCYVLAQSSGNPPKNLRPLIVSVAAAVTISDMESKVKIMCMLLESLSRWLFFTVSVFYNYEPCPFKWLNGLIVSASGQ